MPNFPWQQRPIDFAGIFNSAANFRRMQMDEQKMADAKTGAEREQLQQQKTAKEWQSAQQSFSQSGDVNAAVSKISDPALAAV